MSRMQVSGAVPDAELETDWPLAQSIAEAVHDMDCGAVHTKRSGAVRQCGARENRWLAHC